jgi:hypothetical protein
MSERCAGYATTYLAAALGGPICQSPRSPFLDNFRMADDWPRDEPIPGF